jgi:hypothetical protein
MDWISYVLVLAAVGLPCAMFCVWALCRMSAAQDRYALRDEAQLVTDSWKRDAGEK